MTRLTLTYAVVSTVHKTVHDDIGVF